MALVLPLLTNPRVWLMPLISKLPVVPAVRVSASPVERLPLLKSCTRPLLMVVKPVRLSEPPSFSVPVPL